MPPISRRLAAIAWLTAAALTAGCGGAAGGVDGDANPPVTSAHVTLRDSSVEHTTPDRPQGALVPVRQVTDGDTLQVDIAGERERVRLIGIDTPERGECLADAAADRLSQLLEGGEVHLEVDTTDRDRYGRMLRYAHVDDIFINEALVADGLAIARRYPPDTGQADVLESAQADAKAAKLGMWGDQACGSTAAGADHMELSALRADPPGDDNADLNGEWVELTNTSDASIDLTGWGIKDESASHRYSFPNGFELKAGATVRLSTGCGTDEARRLYWCMTNSAVWNNSGDTAFLLDPNGNITDTYRYDDTGERRS